MSDDSSSADPIERDPRALTGVVVLLLGLSPTLLAIWAMPGFVTQDGPAHTYNAHILLEALRLGSASPFAEVFEPNWRPLPNLGGHLILMGLLSVLPGPASDRAMTTISLVGVAGAVLGLRYRVAGRRGLGISALLSALLAINMPWLLGFSNFLIGMTLTLVTWSLWWGWRDHLGPTRLAVLAALLVLGYFGHLVSVGLAAFGLVVLAVMAPGQGRDRRRRLFRTLIACLPLLPLAVLYKTLASEGGAFEPVWEQSGAYYSPRFWVRRALWIDPITIGRRDIAPIVRGLDGQGCLALSPSLWMGLALVVACGATVRHRGGGPTGRSAWATLSGLLLLGAAVGPDGFGDKHGYFLTQRVALIGLAALVPALELVPGRRSTRLAAGLFAVGLGLQSAFVWDYAIESSHRAGAVLAARSEIGRGVRVGTLLIDTRGRYRSNPLLHADCLLGVGTGNIIWSNYETLQYYFPVQVRPGLDAPPANLFEHVALLDGPDDADVRVDLWEDVLQRYGSVIDAVLVRGRNPTLEAITARWAGGGPTAEQGAIRIYQRATPGSPNPRPADNGPRPTSSPN